MINRIKGFLFVICIITLFTAQSKRPEDTERSGKSERSASHTSDAQHVSNAPNNQASPRVEAARAPQATPKTTHRATSQTHVAQPTRQERTTSQAYVAQPTHQERTTPRVYAFASPVENKQPLGRQHHNYWHPRYNFYNHQYHFYPYINVASRVELSPACVQVLFNGQLYYYDYCVFYVQEAGGYLAVPPPIGIIVSRISSHAAQVIINGRLYYTYNDVYYEPVPGGYRVVEPLR